jgi:hypothetical protein
MGLSDSTARSSHPLPERLTEWESKTYEWRLSMRSWDFIARGTPLGDVADVSITSSFGQSCSEDWHFSVPFIGALVAV